MKIWKPAILAAVAGCAAPAAPAAAGPDLKIAWDRNFLTIRADGDPFPPVQVWYLEAYCRSGSTARKWQETVIPHTTEKVRDDGRSIELLCGVEGGVEVRHVITAGRGAVDFQVVAVNKGPAHVDAVWAQPCVRVGPFTGADKTAYVKQAFIFVEGRQAFLDTTGPPAPAIYTPGQVFLPPGIDPADANPRPHCPQVPSNGLIGAVSADGKWLVATAWDPYQELFQGIIACIHSDFRLGGLKPGETRRARGKIYVMDNDVDALLARYRADFPAVCGEDEPRAERAAHPFPPPTGGRGGSLLRSSLFVPRGGRGDDLPPSDFRLRSSMRWVQVSLRRGATHPDGRPAARVVLPERNV